MTVPSIDRQISGETKFDRLNARAKTQPQDVFNNLGHILDAEFLEQTYHQLEDKKAVGQDRMTKQKYGEKLTENIQSLVRRIRQGCYRPQPARVIEIPKEDGSKRPLVISCFEDKLVQSAVSKVLTCLYEPMFLSCSYGFRVGQKSHDALKALNQHAYPCWDGAVVEIDLRQYFDTIPHEELHKMLKHKISDRRFLKLITTLVTAPVDCHQVIKVNSRGCPQGSILSPILANIFLHEVIDVWFEDLKQHHFKGRANEVRYADDMVFIFQSPQEAQRFMDVLPKRLSKYGLEMNQNKSRLIRSGQNVAEREHKARRRLPTYHFLGFTVYWGKARHGKWWRMKFISRRDRFTSKLKGLRAFLKKQRTTKDTIRVLKLVASVIRGWLNYHAVSDNQKRVRQFMQMSRRIVRQWINRRGRRRPMRWATFDKYVEKVQLPKTWKTISMFKSALNKA